MRTTTTQRTYFAVIAALCFMMSGLTGYAQAASAVALGAAETFGGFGGAAGVTNEGVFTVVNGNIGTTAVTSRSRDSTIRAAMSIRKQR